MRKLLLLSFSVAILILGFEQESQTQTEAQTAIQPSAGGPMGSRPDIIKAIALESDQPDGPKPVAEDELRAASAKAIKLIQQSQAVWAKKETCNSCHHQLLPEIPIKLARERGVPLDERVARDSTANTFAYLKDLDATVQGYDYIDVVFDGWQLVAAQAAGVRPSLATSATAQFIASRQLSDGSWPTIDARPPQAYSPFTTTALMLAARDIEKVKLLTERGADVNARAATGVNALMVAARHRGDVEVARLLLKKGAKPNADKGVEVRNDATALFFAVMAGDVQTAGALLDAGARLGDRMKVLGRFAQSPLMYAVFLDPAMVEYLIGKGASPNEVDDDKISVLSWATIGNNAGMVKSLLARGAQVNHVDNFGMTPVLYAASIDFWDTSVVEKLIAAGADVSAKNKEGLTALDLAKKYHHKALANLLAGKTATR